MQLNVLAAAQLAAAPTGAPGVPARVVAGDLARVPVGELLEATVTASTPRGATLTVNGQPLTVQLPPGAPLQQGAVLLLRVPPGAATAPNPTVELSVPASVSAPAAQPLPGAPRGYAAPEAPRTAVVDVLESLPDGRARVRIDGQEQVARPAEPLVPGERYVLQVQRSAAGTVLKPLPPDAPATAREVATAILRAPAADVGTALKPLRAELETLTAPPAKGEPAAPPAVREAATAVRATLEALVPRPGRAPDAAQLQRIVENGGQLFEAKLARAAEGAPAVPTAAKPELPTPATVRTAVPVPTAVPATATAPALEALAARPAVPTPDAPALPAPGNQPSAPVAPQPNVPAKLLEALAARPAPPAPDAAPAPLAAPTERPAPAVAEAPKADARPQDAPRDPLAPAQTREAQTEVRAESRAEARDVASDLKGDLLKLLRAANDIGTAVRVPAAEAALHTIESQQAANALAQANGTAFHLQIPFPDGDQWRTVRLALEPERRADADPRDPASRFRVFMHVPLSELGETYIEAGLSGGSFRATIYLDAPGVRARVGNELASLRAELEAEGFTEVLLDVRASSDLPDRQRRTAGELRAGRSDGTSVLDVRA